MVVLFVSDLCRLRRERQREPEMTAVAARRWAVAGLREAERETPARTETDWDIWRRLQARAKFLARTFWKTNILREYW